MIHSSRHSSAVSIMRRGSFEPAALSAGPRNARSTHAAWAIGVVAPRSAATSGASASGSGGADSRSWGRMPWISTESAVGWRLGRTSPSSIAPATIRPPSIGTAPNAISSSFSRSSPVSSTSTTSSRASRHDARLITLAG